MDVEKEGMGSAGGEQGVHFWLAREPTDETNNGPSCDLFCCFCGTKHSHHIFTKTDAHSTFIFSRFTAPSFFQDSFDQCFCNEGMKGEQKARFN